MSAVAENSLGGRLIGISGPCFDANSEVTCQFGNVSTSAVIANSLRAYCVPPILNDYGIIRLTVSVTNGAEYEEFSTDFTLCKYYRCCSCKTREAAWSFQRLIISSILHNNFMSV